MKVKVLVVEDKRLLLKGIALAIRKIADDKDKTKRHGIDAIIVVEAGSADEAYAELEEALRLSQPYDVIMLDLKIPFSGKGGAPPENNPEVGLAVLKFAKEKGAAREVVVYSAYAQYENVRPAFLLGALDFIPKGEDEGRITDKEALQSAVLSAWDRGLSKQSAKTLEDRFKTLMPFAIKGLTHWFSGCFSRVIQTVAHEAEELNDNLDERLGLEPERDKEDPLIWRLATIQKSVQDAKDEWSSLQTSLTGTADAPQTIVLEEQLATIKNDILPCMTLKRAQIALPPEGRTRALTFSKNSTANDESTFSQDVPIIMREIIIGGLSEVKDRNALQPQEQGQVTFQVTVAQKDDKAEVCIEDNLFPIDKEAANKINKGFNIPPSGDYGRVWGLSVAQHAALMGGGRLAIQPLEGGNKISYFIPLAN